MTVLVDSQVSDRCPWATCLDNEILNISETLVAKFLNILFLLSEASEEESRPKRCVYMANLAESLDGQSWLDDSSLEQV